MSEKNVRIGRRVAARRTADGRLVDDDQFVDMSDAFDAVVFERLPEGAVELLRKDRAQRLVDERRLAGTADARHADEFAEREFGRDVLEVVAPRPADHDALPRAFAERFGNPDTAASGEVVGRDGIGTQDVVDRTRGHDMPALAPRTGADVDDEVGGTHHVLVVFDDDHRVAGIAQLLQAADQAPVVALVQADRGLVEDIKHVDQLRADLRGEANTLALAARERTRRTRQRQVAQPYVHQEAQALADLLDDLLCDLPLLVVHIILDVRHPFRKFGDRHGRHVGDALAADAELERLLLEARTAADRTFAVDEELLAPFLAAFGVLVFGTAYIFGDALPRDEVVAARRTELRKVDGQRLGIAVQHRIQPRLGQ